MKRFFQKNGIMMLAAVVVVAVGLCIASAVSNQTGFLQNAAGVVTYPFRAAGSAVTGWFQSIGERFQTVESLRKENEDLRKENAQLEGKAAFYDLFIDLKHSTNLRTTAKELDVPERRFVRFLIERRFVYRTASGNVLPYANVKNAGLFCVKDYCNHGHTGSYTLITPQGKLYFAQLREMILLVS